jgi:CheY-like chemotaxis protein
MATKNWNVAILGFPMATAKRMGMVLAEKIKHRPDFTFQSEWSDAPCDAVVVDTSAADAKAELLRLRKQWPGAVTLWVSDSGTAGDSDFRLERANLYVKLRPMLEQALEESAIAGGQLPDHKLVPEAKFGKVVSTLSALVIDDSATVRQQITGALQRLGFSAEEAPSGEHALTKIKYKAYDLFLVDVEMPGMDGYTFIKRLHDYPERLRAPVMILSSRSSAFDKVRGALAGSDTFLSKPVNLKDLYQAIDVAMVKYAGGNRESLISRGYRVARS